MKRFELRAWVPRGLEAPLGPLTTNIDDLACEVSMEGAKHDVLPKLGIPGARVRLHFELGDEASDQTAWLTGLTVVVRGVNRVLHLAAFAGENRKRIRGLQFRDFLDVSLVELADVERPIAGEVPFEAPIRIKRTGLTPKTQALLDTIGRQSSSEILWMDSLESAFEERTRDAVVAARAAVEVAWKDAAYAIRDAHAAGASTRALAIIDAHLERVCTDGVALPRQLHDSSQAIFGCSFQHRWSAETWKHVIDLLSTARNRGAHGSGSVDETEAHRAVALARQVLDDIEAVRVAAVAGTAPSPAAI